MSAVMVPKPKSKPPRPVEPVSPTMRLIWRHLRDSGGWHNVYEVAEVVIRELLPQATPQHANKVAGRALWGLERRGHIARPAVCNPRRPRFGVTGRCTAPDGESLQPGEPTAPVFPTPEPQETP